jgi:ABC-2 type transport system permease protein
VVLAILLMTVVLASGVGLGALAAGEGALPPMAGSVVLGCYAAALAGIGVAVGGLVRASLAAPTVAVVVVATFLLDTIVPALRVPDALRQLALTAHLGYPMVGAWDVGGLALLLALSVGGLGLGAWGFRRRDLRG